MQLGGFNVLIALVISEYHMVGKHLGSELCKGIN